MVEIGGKCRGTLSTEAALKNQRYSEAANRAQDRRDREDTAARLLTVVPTLTSLALELNEFRGDGSSPLVSYRKLVVVARAPALFDIQCSDADCSDGGHDLTRAIMSALRKQVTDFSGRDVCSGHRRTESCGRRLEYRAVATYDATVTLSPEEAFGSREGRGNSSYRTAPSTTPER
jgi:hypothetical protein